MLIVPIALHTWPCRRFAFTAFMAVCIGMNFAAGAGEYGLALTSMQYGPYDDPEDCPQGLALTPEETFLRSLSPEKRKEFEDRDKRVGSLATFVSRVVSNRRGPDGQDLCDAPTSVKDPPMPIGQGRRMYGFDLDAGNAANARPHQEFFGPDGQPGIDNQVARLMACVKGVRKSDNRKNQNMDAGIQNGSAITLIRVSDVDDMDNDADVTVEFFKSADKFIKDGNGAALPDATLRADRNAPTFHAVTRGKIVNGELTTEPVDARFMQNPADILIRGARLRIALKSDGHAEGVLGGYYDVASFWDSWSREAGQQQQIGFSCPALYQGLHSLADGHFDAATGQYTAISSAFKVRAVRTFVVPAQSKERFTGDLTN